MLIAWVERSVINGISAEKVYEGSSFQSVMGLSWSIILDRELVVLTEFLPVSHHQGIINFHSASIHLPRMPHVVTHLLPSPPVMCLHHLIIRRIELKKFTKMKIRMQ